MFDATGDDVTVEKARWHSKEHGEIFLWIEGCEKPVGTFRPENVFESRLEALMRANQWAEGRIEGLEKTAAKVRDQLGRIERAIAQIEAKSPGANTSHRGEE